MGETGWFIAAAFRPYPYDDRRSLFASFDGQSEGRIRMPDRAEEQRLARNGALAIGSASRCG